MARCQFQGSDVPFSWFCSCSSLSFLLRSNLKAGYGRCFLLAPLSLLSHFSTLSLLFLLSLFLSHSLHTHKHSFFFSHLHTQTHTHTHTRRFSFLTLSSYQDLSLVLFILPFNKLCLLSPTHSPLKDLSCILISPTFSPFTHSFSIYLFISVLSAFFSLSCCLSSLSLSLMLSAVPEKFLT